jgi:hypothetical protein
MEILPNFCGFPVQWLTVPEDPKLVKGLAVDSWRNRNRARGDQEYLVSDQYVNQQQAGNNPKISAFPLIQALRNR